MEDSNYIYLLLKKGLDGENYGKPILVDLEYEERVWYADNNDIVRIYAMSSTDELAELGAGAYSKILTCSVDVQSDDVRRYGKILDKIKDIVDGVNDIFSTGTATQIYPTKIDKKGAYIDILTMDEVGNISVGDYISYISSGELEHGWVYWIDDYDFFIFKLECEVRMKRIVGQTEHSNRLKKIYRKVIDVETTLYLPRG